MDLFADVTLRECIAAALGFSVGVLLMCALIPVIEALATRGISPDLQQQPYGDVPNMERPRWL